MCHPYATVGTAEWGRSMMQSGCLLLVIQHINGCLVVSLDQLRTIVASSIRRCQLECLVDGPVVANQISLHHI
jgi:hypothetical protein